MLKSFGGNNSCPNDIYSWVGKNIYISLGTGGTTSSGFVPSYFLRTLKLT